MASCLCLGATAALAWPAQVARAGAPSQEQVTQIAHDFCRSVGNPDYGTPSVKDPEPGVDAHDAHAHGLGHGLWHVDFAGSASFWIDGDTGIVRMYIGRSRLKDIWKEKAVPGTGISRDEAVAIAMRAARAAGLKNDELKLRLAQRNTFEGPEQPTIGDDRYQILLQRTLHGIPYRDDVVKVDVLENGDVVGYGDRVTTPPPASMTALLSAQDAVAAAGADLAALGFDDDVLTRCEEEIVTPNTQLLPKGAPAPAAGSRLAWGCFYDAAQHKWHEVWVDAITGAVLGGEIKGVRGIAIPFSRWLAMPGLAVRVLKAEGTRKWSPVGPALTRADLDQLRNAAQSQPRWSEAVNKPEPAYGLTAATSDAPVFFYMPDRSLIGRPGDWYQTPPGFDDWFKKALATPATK